jgi:hypothetical protein
MGTQVERTKDLETAGTGPNSRIGSHWRLPVPLLLSTAGTPPGVFVLFTLVISPVGNRIMMRKHFFQMSNHIRIDMSRGDVLTFGALQRTLIEG